MKFRVTYVQRALELSGKTTNCGNILVAGRGAMKTFFIRNGTPAQRLNYFNGLGVTDVIQWIGNC